MTSHERHEKHENRDHEKSEKDLNHEIHEKHEKIIYKDESYAIQGAVFEVYRIRGSGLSEGVYQECMEIEFGERKIPFVGQPSIQLDYKGRELRHHFQPDFVCFDKIIVELKAVRELLPEHEAQVFNYLRASNLRLALLVNFGHHPQVEIKRIVL
jgi:GxxExxY protein